MPIPFARFASRLLAGSAGLLTFSWLPAPTCAATLGTPPRAPTEQALEALRSQRAAQPQPRATSLPLSVDPTSREAARQFYLGVYSASDNVPAQWTGSVASGNAGDTSATFKAAVLLRINAVRAFAGVPAALTLNSTYSAKAQQAALMMSANGALSHSPPTSWTYYTAAGAEAASNSNLSLGDYGPASITGYIADPGDGNAAAGHRRWLLYPQTREMGTGDVPASGTYPSTNATWVIDSFYGTARPATRDTFVAWPAPGYFPAPLIFPRWSFSYPGATFTNATVAMTRGGTPVAVKLEPVQSGLGENTLVWVYDNLDSGSSAGLSVTSDTTFHVEIANVVVNGAAHSFSYDVTAFDPTRPGSDAVPVIVTGTPSPAVGFANAYTIAQPFFADTVQWRSLQFDNSLASYDAESDLGGLTAVTTGSYGGRNTENVGAGHASYQLATSTFDDQFLTLPETYYAPAGSSPTISFLSRLGTATKGQIAHVQVSTDEGSSWRDVYTQTGTDSNGETSFVARSASLADLAGLTFRIRFAYTWTPGTTAYLQTAGGVGWYFDNIGFTGLQRVASASAATTSTTSFTFNPASAGDYGLQARGLLFGAYPLSWGPVSAARAVSAGTAPTFSTPPASRGIEAGANTSLSASVSGASLQWQLNGRDLAGATGATLALSGFQPASAGLYTLVAANALGTTPTAPAIIGVSTTEKFVGAGQVVGSNIQHPNGNVFDQVLLTGSAEAITADYTEKQVTRTSFVDLDDDIVQVEFSGPGTLTLVLGGASGPALPKNYNQNVSYMKGHAGIIITGATEQTNVSVFSVGRANAVNQALFKDGVTYDGIADLAFIAIQSANGQFGGVRTANANYFADHGTTGLYAPGVTFNGPVYLGNITAFGSATPVILLGAASLDNRITGGDLYQDNGKPVQVSGLTQLKFMEGSDSHGKALPAKPNRAVLQQNGVDVTAQIVVTP